MLPAPPPERFTVAAFDALLANIAIVDAAGGIMAVNRAWSQVSCDNGSVKDVGVNYLAVCDAASGDGGENARAIAGASAPS